MFSFGRISVIILKYFTDLQAFQDLQVLSLESTQKIKISELQVEQLRSTITRARLTEKELDGLPPDTRTYEAVGRMYDLYFTHIFGV
jgi:hypothetical protein